MDGWDYVLFEEKAFWCPTSRSIELADRRSRGHRKLLRLFSLLPNFRGRVPRGSPVMFSIEHDGTRDFGRIL